MDWFPEWIGKKAQETETESTNGPIYLLQKAAAKLIDHHIYISCMSMCGSSVKLCYKGSVYIYIYPEINDLNLKLKQQ